MRHGARTWCDGSWGRAVVDGIQIGESACLELSGSPELKQDRLTVVGECSVQHVRRRAGCSGARKDGEKTWNSAVPSGTHDPTNVSPCFDMTAHQHSEHTPYDAQQRTNGDAPLCLTWPGARVGNNKAAWNFALNVHRERDQKSANDES